MNETNERPPEILPRPGGATIAYRRLDGKTPGVMFLGGLMSDMQGTKALELENYCRAAGRAFIRFDYQGHGESSGNFADGTIGSWAEDALTVFDECTEGSQILVGSSMGGWTMLLTALARPDRVAGMIGIAAAPDFTEDLMWDRFDDVIRGTLEREGVYYEPSEFGDKPYTITKALIEDGRNHLLLRRPIALHCPVRLLHGMRDDSVPWMTSSRIAEKLMAEDVRIFLVKDGDHRLSRDKDIAQLKLTLDELFSEL
ncbi:MAG: alpha/beta hydrolase [Pseudomonadota bacterium]|jgi:pimeloyl-ACP methyl ester carboxylesterase|nr:alpha/beta hydrolase [Pseudomonadota bacterium]|tara:strand:- start:661 stop:1428 length:768 start_codon:yes stop_codon:yes gene_type:complete